MTKREARKVALRLVAEMARSYTRTAALAAHPNMGAEDLEAVAKAAEHIAAHLEWEADGRRTAFK